jgi:hypothetical protein
MFDVKKAPFTGLNPNGRTPVIVDHNNEDVVLWGVKTNSNYGSVQSTDEKISQSQ